ncbi:MAG: hypothetical protein AAF193_03640 [Bacteroidota bacterium]
MKKSIFVILIASAALIACNGEPTKDQQATDNNTQTDSTELSGPKVNDPRPEIKANLDSLRYNYTNITPNGLYPVNRASYTAINVMPPEPFEKLFVGWPECSRKDERVVMIDRRRFVLTPDLSIQKDGDQINYKWNASQEVVDAFLSRFSSDKIALVVNHKVMVIATANQLSGKEGFSSCSAGDLDKIQDLLDNPLKEKEEPELPEGY